MSTRAIIATVTGDHLSGRYHHSDGYPSYLGTVLLKMYREFQRDGGLTDMRRVLLDEHPAGWSFLGDTVTPTSFVRAATGVMPARGSYDYSVPRCYCHWRGESGTPLIECHCGMGDNSKCDPLMHEWIYVLNTNGLLVLVAVPNGPGIEDYAHLPVDTLPWDASGTDVEEVEKKGLRLFSEGLAERKGASPNG